MLPKQHRLPHQEIARVRKLGNRIEAPPLRLFITSATTKESRFAILVPKKIVANAVDRNRWKRIISESLYSLFPQLPPTDGVIQLTKDTKGLKTQDITVILTKALTT